MLQQKPSRDNKWKTLVSHFLSLGRNCHRQATATYAQLSVCSNYFSIPAIEYFLANFNFYNNMEFNPSFTHSKLYKYTV